MEGMMAMGGEQKLENIEDWLAKNGTLFTKAQRFSGKSASAALPKTNLKGDCATMVGILRPTDQPELPAKWRGKFTGFTQTT